MGFESDLELAGDYLELHRLEEQNIGLLEFIFFVHVDYSFISVLFLCPIQSVSP